MNPLLALALFGSALCLWVLSDRRVRSARSLGLVLVAVAIWFGVVLVVPDPWGFPAAVVAPTLVMYPFIVRHPLLAPLERQDAEMVNAVELVSRKTIRASRRYAKERSIPEFVARLQDIRSSVRKFQPPDDEWRRVLRELDSELRGTIASVERRERLSPAEMTARRSALRTLYRDLVRRRTKFWR